MLCFKVEFYKLTKKTHLEKLFSLFLNPPFKAQALNHSEINIKEDVQSILLMSHLVCSFLEHANPK